MSLMDEFIGTPLLRQSARGLERHKKDVKVAGKGWSGRNDSVGHDEVWKPSAFVSSRTKRATHKKGREVEKLMDDDDLQSHYGKYLESTHEHKRIDSQSIGDKILSREGWSVGDMVGLERPTYCPHELARALNPGRNCSQQNNGVEQNRCDFVEDYERNDIAYMAKSDKLREREQQIRTTLKFLHTGKHDLRGLGYQHQGLLPYTLEAQSLNFSNAPYTTHNLVPLANSSTVVTDKDKVLPRIGNILAEYDPLEEEQRDIMDIQNDVLYHSSEFLHQTDTQQICSPNQTMLQQLEQHSGVDSLPVLEGYAISNHNKICHNDELKKLLTRGDMFPTANVKKSPAIPSQDVLSYITHFLAQQAESEREIKSNLAGGLKHPFNRCHNNGKIIPPPVNGSVQEPLWSACSSDQRQALLAHLFPSNRFVPPQGFQCEPGPSKDHPEKSDRTMSAWRPEPVLCKRFDLRDPYLQQTYISPESVPAVGSWREVSNKIEKLSGENKPDKKENKEVNYQNFDRTNLTMLGHPLKPPPLQLLLIPDRDLLMKLFGTSGDYKTPEIKKK